MLSSILTNISSKELLGIVLHVQIEYPIFHNISNRESIFKEILTILLENSDCIK